VNLMQVQNNKNPLWLMKPLDDIDRRIEAAGDKVDRRKLMREREEIVRDLARQLDAAGIPSMTGTDGRKLEVVWDVKHAKLDRRRVRDFLSVHNIDWDGDLSSLRRMLIILLDRGVTVPSSLGFYISRIVRICAPS
jgi:hypothetical protein